MSHTVRHLVQSMLARDARGDAAQGADPRFMREHNRLLVLNCVREHEPITRVAIARLTGLSRTTISSIMDGLLKEELVREGETQSAAPAGGRRAILVHFNACAGYVIGADMGRTHLVLLLTDLAANVVARFAGPFDVNLGPEVCLPQLATAMRSFLSEQQVNWNQVVGVGIGIPGPFDASRHMLAAPPRMPGWGGVDVRRILGRELGVPAFVDNDANMGALGESRYGAGRGIPDLAYIKIGTGIGAGLVIGDRLYRGSQGSAGEIGHVTVDPDGPACACGNRGCLEAMAGADAIVEEVRRHRASVEGHALPMVAASSHQPARDADLDVADVVRAALDGDSASRGAIERAGERVGVVLAGLVNLTNPSLILVEGGVARAGNLLLDPIRREVAARSFPIASSHTRISSGALGDNAIALGCVATVLDAAFGTARMAARPTHSAHSASATTGGAMHTRRGSNAPVTGQAQNPTSRAARDPPAVAPGNAPHGSSHGAASGGHSEM